jgi:hypothetical protein
LQARALRRAQDSIHSQDYQSAWNLLAELASVDGAAEKSRALRRRVLAHLRRSMREIESGDEQGRQTIARRILELEPLEPTALRFAALSSMRLDQFDESLGHWTKLRELGQGDARIDLQIKKCRMQIERQQRKVGPFRSRGRSVTGSSASPGTPATFSMGDSRAQTGVDS